MASPFFFFIAHCETFQWFHSCSLFETPPPAMNPQAQATAAKSGVVQFSILTKAGAAKLSGFFSNLFAEALLLRPKLGR